ncbi:mRNA-decapping enzyme 1B isoform X2 [Synchiropus splendidus]|uniref:mRNA-decapping enzyme 1B isoform X2 n=1 Tax=Synchiropus splendidus TaxID=270530 RepID=UPI00237ED7E2|nr:mRNA-decapping enzyme 1B isoform X2 [Synchiropus splendidus]
MLPSSRGSVSTGGLEMSPAALQRLDPYIRTIVDETSQVALYTFNSQSSQWEKTEVEGTLFIYNRLTSPCYGFTIMNKLNMQSVTEAITQDLDLQLQEPFLLYRNARSVIHGIWFYERWECRRVADLMKLLIQQEQVQFQSQTNACDPLDRAALDIVRMLTRAQSQYETKKASSEPKEIRVSEDLHRNLIKPIPVKPSTRDAKSSGLKSISQNKLVTSNAPDLTAAAWRCCPPVAGILPVRKNTGHRGAEVLSGDRNQQLNCPTLQKLPKGQWGTSLPPTENSHRHHLHSSSHRSGMQHVLSPSRPLHHSERFSQGSGLPVGFLSSHDLLQKLQLVQQQQTRVCLGLATSQKHDRVYSGLQSEAQLQVVCPERFPASSSAPTLLLSPSVFEQFQSSRHYRVLSRSQLQATLLHLIQSDSSFLDNIYHAYISRSSSVCSSK